MPNFQVNNNCLKSIISSNFQYVLIVVLRNDPVTDKKHAIACINLNWQCLKNNCLSENKRGIKYKTKIILLTEFKAYPAIQPALPKQTNNTTGCCKVASTLLKFVIKYLHPKKHRMLPACTYCELSLKKLNAWNR